MKNIIRPALSLFFAFTLLTGIVYPLVVTAIAQIFFSHQANGSLIKRDGKTIGSELIGQNFDAPQYFWGRLSATSPAYNAAASGGSNFGPLHPDLQKQAQARIAALKKYDPQNTAPIPIDLVTASGSGLDPHISIAVAHYQIARVARVRGISEAKIKSLVEANTQGRTFGLLGEPRVNVLKLNLAMSDER